MTDSLEIFRSGTLLMQSVTGELPPAAESPDSVSILVPVLIVFAVSSALFFFRNIFNALPPVFRCLFLQRGTVKLESSVRTSLDRNITALLLIVPFCMLLDLTGIYAPRFLDGADGGVHLAMTAGMFLIYLLFRLTIYIELRPRSAPDSYILARKSAWNFFIIIAVVTVVTGGTLGLLHADPNGIRKAILTEISLLYALLLIRRGRILSLSCNPFIVFLYLCALEIVPTGLFVASAVVL